VPRRSKRLVDLAAEGLRSADPPTVRQTGRIERQRFRYGRSPTVVFDVELDLYRVPADFGHHPTDVDVLPINNKTIGLGEHSGAAEHCEQQGCKPAMQHRIVLVMGS